MVTGRVFYLGGGTKPSSGYADITWNNEFLLASLYQDSGASNKCSPMHTDASSADQTLTSKLLTKAHKCTYFISTKDAKYAP